MNNLIQPDIHLPDISTGELHKRILLDWSLPPDYAMCLEKYYILHWSRAWFINQTRKVGITHQGVFYAIVFKHGQTIADVISTPTVAISFRKMHTMAYGYAMVKGVQKELPEQPESNHV